MLTRDPMQSQWREAVSFRVEILARRPIVRPRASIAFSVDEGEVAGSSLGSLI